MPLRTKDFELLATWLAEPLGGRRQRERSFVGLVDPSESCSAVDLSSSRGLGSRKLVFTRNGLVRRTHKVRIEVLRGKAKLDGFAVLR